MFENATKEDLITVLHELGETVDSDLGILEIEARQKTENEIRIREARHKEEKEARLRAEEEAKPKAEDKTRLKAEEETRLKAEEESRLNAKVEVRLKAEVEVRLKAEEKTKAVEERRKMEEAKRMNEKIALEEEEMSLKKERWLAEQQMQRVQEEHKMRMKAEQKRFQEDVKEWTSKINCKMKSRKSQKKTWRYLKQSRRFLCLKENKPRYLDEIEEEKPKLPERKLKKLSRMTVAELQRKVNLKASSNIILIPQHWSFKRKYSQDKGGIEKLAWKLLDFTKRIGIIKVWQSLRERKDQKTMKVNMKKGVIRKLRKSEVEFQKRQK
ncbi:putative splicing factor 3b subunit 2 [Trichonephila inaurata madagascariensis]|uniref:Putative splicing factor 3b subunit 2 n=1 Tax=Trichonephila inaurata madagascariensis TaxID=2747483 RepID=A0A8X6YS05_9ARAC|nr:putative splicing factor 3b subunit 2 [Trichonephila inaurata madagascariensis]